MVSKYMLYLVYVKRYSRKKSEKTQTFILVTSGALTVNLSYNLKNKGY